MSVVYDVVYADNRRIPIMGPCFGGFSDDREFPGHSLRHADVNRRRETRETMRNLWRDRQSARFVQFYGQPSASQWSVQGEDKSVWIRRYYDEMKILLADIPWLKASVHPLLGVIRVPCYNVQADKVMMTLFLVRNLAHYDYARGYRVLRESGMKPFAAAILSSMWKASIPNAFNPETQWYYNAVGEYNWLSPYTFGKASLRQLLEAPDDFNPWVQETWNDQNGYRRDRWFSQRQETFNPTLGEDGQALPYHRGSSHYRKLIDCLSIQDDEPIWDIIRTEYTTGDWTNHDWTTGGEMGNTNMTSSQWDTVLFEFVEQCRDAGYEPYES
ncbi:MAG: hypothetical protein ACRC6V_05080 [Bacteroidales bacterium]